MKEIKYKKILIFLAILSGITIVLYYAISRAMNKTFFDFLIWNLCLAWIPFVISISIYELNRQAKRKYQVISIVLGMVWLLFFPNSPYIITDLIHLTVLKNTYVDHGRLTFEYWYDFLLIILFAWNGLLLGCISAYQIHFVIYRKLNPLAPWLFIAGTSLLGGYGVLLGREHRLNSWDVITDSKQLLFILQNSWSLKAGLFCLLFGIVIAFVYITFYILINYEGNARK